MILIRKYLDRQITLADTHHQEMPSSS